MIKDIGALMQDIDIRRALIKEFYGVSMQNPSWIIRGRAGWELLKMTRFNSRDQRKIVELCDMTMSNKELYQLLESENLKIIIK